MDDVFLPGVTDLFGDPVPRSRGRRGKPPHVPTAENRRFVQLALACERDEEAIAAALRITSKTLRRHYFHELQGKDSAKLRLEMKNMAAIVAGVEAGKPAAMALLDKKLTKEGQRALAARYTQRVPAATPVGKKEAAKAAAAGVTGIYAPPPAAMVRH